VDQNLLKKNTITLKKKTFFSKEEKQYSSIFSQLNMK